METSELAENAEIFRLGAFIQVEYRFTSSEYRTAAIYYATATSPERLDRVYSQLLRAAGISKDDALLYCGLAPLNVRGEISMLGLIRRTNLGMGALHGHSRQLRSYRTGRYLDVVAHSLLGAIDVYNILPEFVVEANNVSEFQTDCNKC